MEKTVLVAVDVETKKKKQMVMEEEGQKGKAEEVLYSTDER